MAERDRLPRTPVFVVNFRTVFGSDGAHVSLSLVVLRNEEMLVSLIYGFLMRSWINFCLA
ncbi:hypothetical protein NON20_24580 (plasmid) [Synechocystis sp. B12]|nr:hypothetical protein NON20_24580 [Synechocystis sp. B12]